VLNALRRPAAWRAAARHVAVPLGLVLLAAVLLLTDPAWLRQMRQLVFDQYQRWQPRVWQDTPVRVIDVDEESLARLGQWPWPRTRMAQLVRRAQDAQAAAIGFDVVFSEPDRTSPRWMQALWDLPPAQAAALASLPDHDAVFAEAIARGGVVLGLALQTAEAGAGAGTGAEVETEPAAASAAASSPEAAAASATPPSPALPLKARFVQLGAAAEPYLPSVSAAMAPLPVLAAAAAGHGAIAFLPDRDGVVRRVPMLMRVGGQLLPSLSAEMLRVGQREANYFVRADDGPGGGMSELRVGGITLPTSGAGELWVHYAPPAPQRTIPAWKLLQGQVPPEELQGRLLLVGSSAQGLMDLRFSPLGQIIPGVEVHAQTLELALTGGLLQRPAWAPAAEALALVLCGVLVGVLAVAVSPALSVGATLAVLAALGTLAWWAFAGHRLLLDPLMPAFGVLAGFAAPSLLRYQASERRRRWVAQAFSRYVSPNLVAHIVQHPEQLELGGRRQQCSFVFTDLAGFTALMEKVDPAAAVGLLNDYLEGMLAIVFQHQGTLDRIVGDAIAIMFSAPLPQPDHRRRALACALALQRFATDFALRQQAAGMAFGHTRIGVHSGEVIVGNFGGGTMFDYRALGDPVNTAARLETANKHLGTRLCVSDAVLADCPGTPVRCVGRLVLQGKTQPLRVFQPAHDGLDLPVDAAALQRYADAYALMADGRPEALAAFEALAREQPDEPLVRLHLGRLRRGESGDVIALSAK
jgi:adenylate cyclase